MRGSEEKTGGRRDCEGPRGFLDKTNPRGKETTLVFGRLLDVSGPWSIFVHEAWVRMRELAGAHQKGKETRIPMRLCR